MAVLPLQIISANSISIGSSSTDGFPGKWTSDSYFPRLRTPGRPFFSELDSHWSPVDQQAPVSNWTPDSCSPHRVTLDSSLKPRTNCFFYRSCSFDFSTYVRKNFICFCKTLLWVEGIKMISLCSNADGCRRTSKIGRRIVCCWDQFNPCVTLSMFPCLGVFETDYRHRTFGWHTHAHWSLFWPF